MLTRTVGVEPDVLLPAYRGENCVEYDAGAIGSREYWARISAEASVDVGWQVALMADLTVLGVKDETTISSARGLNRSGLMMGMLSNIPCDLIRWMRWHNPWTDELFDPVLLSCRLRSVKPDEEAFTVVLARLSQSVRRELAPEDVLSVDGSPKNVEAVKKSDFLGHCFENLGTLLAKIESI